MLGLLLGPILEVVLFSHWRFHYTPCLGCWFQLHHTHMYMMLLMYTNLPLTHALTYAPTPTYYTHVQTCTCTQFISTHQTCTHTHTHTHTHTPYLPCTGGRRDRTSWGKGSYPTPTPPHITCTWNVKFVIGGSPACTWSCLWEKWLYVIYTGICTQNVHIQMCTVQCALILYNSTQHRIF